MSSPVPDLTIENRPYAEVLEEGGNLYYRETAFAFTSAYGTLYTAWNQVSSFANVFYMTAEGTVNLTSTNAADDVAGTGAQKATIVYLDQALAIHTVEVDLDGTNPVAIGTDVYRILHFYVSQVGSGGANVGNLELKSGANLVGRIEASFNYGKGLFYTIPAGYRGIVKTPQVGAVGDGVRQRLLIREAGGVWQVRGNTHLWASGFYPSSTPAIEVPEGTDIEIKQETTGSGIGYHTLEVVCLPTNTPTS